MEKQNIEPRGTEIDLGPCIQQDHVWRGQHQVVIDDDLLSLSGSKVPNVHAIVDVAFPLEITFPVAVARQLALTRLNALNLKA